MYVLRNFDTLTFIVEGRIKKRTSLYMLKNALRKEWLQNSTI